MYVPNSFDTIAIGAYRNSKDNIGIHTTLDAAIQRIKSAKIGLASTDPKASASQMISSLSAREAFYV